MQIALRNGYRYQTTYEDHQCHTATSLNDQYQNQKQSLYIHSTCQNSIPVTQKPETHSEHIYDNPYKYEYPHKKIKEPLDKYPDNT